MYLRTSVGTGTCPAGNWLVQRESDDDYVDAQMSYFELKGAEGTPGRARGVQCYYPFKGGVVLPGVANQIVQ